MYMNKKGWISSSVPKTDVEKQEYLKKINDKFYEVTGVNTSQSSPADPLDQVKTNTQPTPEPVSKELSLRSGMYVVSTPAGYTKEDMARVRQEIRNVLDENKTLDFNDPRFKGIEINKVEDNDMIIKVEEEIVKPRLKDDDNDEQKPQPTEPVQQPAQEPVTAPQPEQAPAPTPAPFPETIKRSEAVATEPNVDKGQTVDQVPEGAVVGEEESTK